MSDGILPGGFGTPTSDDSRPWLWVSMVVACGYSVLTLFARIFAKWGLLGVEDIIIGVGYIFAVVNWGLFGQATKQGLGSVSSKNPQSTSELFFTSQVILLVSIYIVKLSVLWFARKIFSGTVKKNKRMFDAALGVIAVFGIISIVLSAVSCDFRLALAEPGDSCSGMDARQTAIQVLDAITEVMLVAIPTIFVIKNSINWGSKLTVIVLFGFRLPNIAFMAAYAVSFRQMSNSSSIHPTQAATATAVWSQVLLGYSLSSASVPCIRSFLTAFLPDAIYRVYDTRYGSYAQGSVVTGSDPANKTGTQRSANRSRSVRGASGMRSPTNGTVNSTVNRDRDDEADSVASDASQRIMIERSVQIDVTSEAAKGQNGQRRGEWFDIDSQPVYR